MGTYYSRRTPYREMFIRNAALFLLLICLRTAYAFKPLLRRQKSTFAVLNVYKNGSYRLWDDAEGIKSLPLIGKATGSLLNLAADLLRIQGSVLPLSHSYSHDSLLIQDQIVYCLKKNSRI